MIDIVAWMVVKNDAYYVDMAIRSVLPCVRGIYVQDQMSTDGTYDIVLALARETKKIIVERVDTGQEERFTDQYNEPFFRSYALEQAEKSMHPRWLLKLDADEIYTDHFFDQLERYKLDLEKGTYMAVRIAGDRFISREHRSVHPSAMEQGYVDPHTHLWSSKLGVRYVPNPHMSGFMHCVPSPEPKPLLRIPGICNVHLHRTFGPKSLKFWAEGGDVFDPNVRPFHAPSMAPKWYNSSVNMGHAERVNFRWPKFVLEKWEQWGIW